MIIDAHHHMLPLTFNEKQIAKAAEFRFANYGPPARGGGVQVSLEEIRERLASYAPDPHGEKLLERMAREGIDRTVLLTVDNFELGVSDEDILDHNKICADIANGSQGRIIPMAGIDPRRKDAPELFRRCIEEFGMKGLKWHPDHGYYPNSRESYAVLAVAEKLNVPLLTHTGPLPRSASPRGIRRVKYCDPVYLDDITWDFPELRIIAAHMGRLAWRDWAQLAQFRPNLYGDLAMWQTFALTNYQQFCQDLRRILDVAGADSVLFGSDAPGFTCLVPNEQFIKIMYDLPNNAPAGTKFTREEINRIMGKNAEKVFNLA
jgi:predicted TIM-barrel fold metal-dependent hydrolase